jgi:outer membrane immunogenic protein
MLSLLAASLPNVMCAQATQGQAATPATDQQTGEPKPERFEAALSYMGSFPSAATGNGVHQGASSSGGVLADFRWLLSVHHGLEFDYGFTRDTEQYSSFDTSNAVHTNVQEATASYVFRAPVQFAIPFVSAGGGALVFDPMHAGTLTPTLANTQARAAFVYSVGIDFMLTSHLRLRQEYRAFVLRAPDFGTGVGSDAPQYISEALAGLAWRL